MLQYYNTVYIILYYIVIMYYNVCVCSVMSNSSQLHGVSPSGSSVHGIFQAWILEQVAISSSKESSQPGIKLTNPASPALTGWFFTT